MPCGASTAPPPLPSEAATQLSTGEPLRSPAASAPPRPAAPGAPRGSGALPCRGGASAPRGSAAHGACPAGSQGCNCLRCAALHEQPPAAAVVYRRTKAQSCIAQCRNNRMQPPASQHAQLEHLRHILDDLL